MDDSRVTGKIKLIKIIKKYIKNRVITENIILDTQKLSIKQRPELNGQKEKVYIERMSLLEKDEMKGKVKVFHDFTEPLATIQSHD